MRSTPVPASGSPDSTTCRTSVPCALAADRHHRRAARPVGAGGFLLVLTLLVALLGLTACDHEVEITPPKASKDSATERASQAQQALDALVRAIRDGSREQAVATASGGARDLLGWVYDNARSLGVED